MSVLMNDIFETQIECRSLSALFIHLLSSFSILVFVLQWKQYKHTEYNVAYTNQPDQNQNHPTQSTVCIFAGE